MAAAARLADAQDHVGPLGVNRGLHRGRALAKDHGDLRGDDLGARDLARQALHGLERGVDGRAAKGLEPGDQYLHENRFLSGTARAAAEGMYATP